MAVRDAASLQSAAESIAALQKQCVRQPTADMQKAADARLLEAQLTLAICILKAENLRRESRGSHYRADYPTQNTAYNQRILVQKQGEILCIEREKQ
ncbi:MAG: hypothetical protein RR900_04460, partial [Ruthenibacterium sp.]